MKATLITAGMVLALAGPAFAQAVGVGVGPAGASFYVVQDTATKRCTIVDKRPTVKTTTIVSPSGKVFKTREEAETAMKTIKVCSSP